MPYLTKREINQFIRTGCMRQLRLNLSPDTGRFQHERDAEGMPPVQPPRPGLPHIVEAGRIWEEEKLHELVTTFGEASIIGDRTVDRRGRNRFQPIQLGQRLDGVPPHTFLVEASFAVGATFENDMGIAGHRDAYGLEYGTLRPDLLQVLPARSRATIIDPAGRVSDVSQDDLRLQLRVIDIKLTAEPSPSYFAEVVYYSTVLAGWLVDRGLHNRFVVVPHAALWPGTHDASHVMVRFRELQSRGEVGSLEVLSSALEADLEEVPFEVFRLRLARFLREEVPHALSHPWRDLDWHVDNRCKGCDYLGFPWRARDGGTNNHPDQCVPMADTLAHLSRVAFMSRGASASLRGQNIDNVTALATLPAQDAAFDSHQVLRATRTVVAGRARALSSNVATIPNEAGSSAVMPKWTDLRIYVSVDFDIGSAISIAFGLKAFWLAPNPGPDGQRARRAWDRRAFVVDRKSLADEERELLAFLNEINLILDWARRQVASTTFQVYVWDNLQYDHMTRVFGRHLQAILRDSTIQRLAWLFPPEEVVPNPATATRACPVTVIRDIIKALVAAPIPHYYSLLAIARAYHRAGLPDNVAAFSVHPLFEDPLSDQVPSERAHEIWSHSTDPHWTDQLDHLRETVGKRLSALEAVTERLQDDLSDALAYTAPRISAVGPPDRANRVSVDGQLWYAFAKLDAAIQQLEVHRVRAMPPHEREARFECARLRERLTGAEEAAALATLGVQPGPNRVVYALRESSRDVKLRESDFNWALAPESEHGYLDRRLPQVVRGTALDAPYSTSWNVSMDQVLAVTVVALSREELLIALDLSEFGNHPAIRDDLQAANLLDLSQNLVLDRTFRDYFTKRLLKSLQDIGNPQIAGNSSLVRAATGQLTGRGARRTARRPVADAIWDVRSMQSAGIARELTAAREVIEASGYALNDSQWRAWEAALSRRLQLIWGPPGTGKSRTLVAIVLGSLIASEQSGQSIRVLVCTTTYNALDNVLESLLRWSQATCPRVLDQAFRLRSDYARANTSIDERHDVPLNQRQPSARALQLRRRLLQRDGTTLVAAPPEQAHKLIALEEGSDAVQEMFDLIVIDEASQMDVAHALLPFGGMAAGAGLVLAADPLQLPPITQAEPPTNLEAMVGSIYDFYRNLHRLDQEMLEVNYRSNAAIVNFAHVVGYRRELVSWSPELRVHLSSELPMQRPAEWPEELFWTPEWSSLLDPNDTCVCVVYKDGRSSQSNAFEADAIAALLCLLHGRLCGQLANERRAPEGDIIDLNVTPMGSAEFWRNGVGVVTPHRAQQGLIVSRLQKLFQETETDPADIRDAVDTVERFQGQQRDIMLASYSLGDPDQISLEDEFLLSLNRFNVMASRARAKLVVFVSQEVVDHLAYELPVVRDSRLLKVYAESFCDDGRAATLGVIENGIAREVPVTVRRPSL